MSDSYCAAIFGKKEKKQSLVTENICFARTFGAMHTVHICVVSTASCCAILNAAKAIEMECGFTFLIILFLESD